MKEKNLEQNEKISQEGLILKISRIIKKIIKHNDNLKKQFPSIFNSSYQFIEKPKELVISKDFHTLSSNDEEEEIIVPLNKKGENIIDFLSTEDLIKRFVILFEVKEDVLVLFMINLDKVLKKKFILNYRNVNRMIFTCLVATQKFHDDECYKDKDYAKVAGINPREMVNLELEFLDLIDFQFLIDDEYFKRYKNKLINYNI